MLVLTLGHSHYPDSSPHLKMFNLMTFAKKTLLPCRWHIQKSLELGYGHLWGAIIQLSTASPSVLLIEQERWREQEVLSYRVYRTELIVLLDCFNVLGSHFPYKSRDKQAWLGVSKRAESIMVSKAQPPKHACLSLCSPVYWILPEQAQKQALHSWSLSSSQPVCPPSVPKTKMYSLLTKPRNLHHILGSTFSFTPKFHPTPQPPQIKSATNFCQTHLPDIALHLPPP